MQESDEEPGVPGALRIAATVMAVEAAAVLAFAIVELFKIDSDRIGLGVTNAVFFCLYAVGLAFCARGLVRLQSWSRGPAMLGQLIQLGVAWSFRGGDTSWIALVLAAPALVVVAILLSPVTTEALYGVSSDPADEQRP